MRLPRRRASSEFTYIPPEFTGAHFGRHTRIRVLGGEIISSIPSDGGVEWIDDVTGRRTTNLRAVLEGIRRRALDLSEPFNAFREVWYSITREQFASEGELGEQEWAPLTEAYARWKAKAYPGMPLLRATDRLMQSLLGGPEGVWRAGPRSLQYGSTVPYFEAHMTGTETMPARPPLVLPMAAFEELNRGVMGWVMGGTVDYG